MSDFELSSDSAHITLDSVTKTFGQGRAAAVDNISMTMPAGKITVFVGPSGCGKTTTMRMINRLVEPTFGRITIGDKDLSSYNPDLLRRHIGYAIQRVGLLPHLTVAQNVAMVPKLLKWPKARINERVDSLLNLMGLDPAQYRDRSPSQLSGGQQQRVGVARALAGDPPVLLMDEPFGAVDPVTRARLQDELLRIQSEVRKTVVFVTHDFDEALLLGDMLAIFGPGSRLEQFDTPSAVLAAPASELVRSFIGGGAAFKRLRLMGLLEFVRPELAPGCAPGDMVVSVTTSAYEAINAVLSDPRAAVSVIDAGGSRVGWIDLDSVTHAMRRTRPMAEPAT